MDVPMDARIEINPLIPGMPRCTLGEGPYYDALTDRLLWVDIEGHKIHTYAFTTKLHKTIDTPAFDNTYHRVSFVTLAENGAIIAGLEDGIYRYREGTWTNLALCSTDRRNRFNDGKTSPDGRFLFAGTMNLGTGEGGKREPTGSLYRMDTNGIVTKLRDGVFTSNGIGWSPDGRTLYYIDTGLRKIMVFDYDAENGSMTRERDFATGKRFDGLCVSDDGHVLVAIWGEAVVEVYAPTGDLVRTIDIPAPQTTCPVLGGYNAQTLFVTTASQLSEAELGQYPMAGQVFAVTGLPYRAQKAARFKLNSA